MDGEDAGLLQQLRRRKVVQWGIAYAAGAWGLLQGIAYMRDTFGWPQQLQQVATIVLFIGLPIAVVLAWYHGERGEQRVSGIELAILTALLLLGGGLFAWFGSAQRPPDAASAGTAPVAAAIPAGVAEKSIAVLPFANRSAREEDAFFAEGMHDDLLTQLAQIRDVRVISRTSVMRYAGSTKPIHEIAAELGVGTVLEGGVQRAGNRVRINAQLIDAATDAHLWSETFDRELTVENLLDIQSEITGAIATALQSVLVGDAAHPAEKLPTRSTEAYDAYLLGNTLSRYELRDPETIQRGIRAYAEAVRLDPEFAAAYARKTVAHLMLVWWTVDPAENLALAQQALERARALAPDAIATHVAEGYYRYWGQLDYAGANAALDTVLKQAPQNASLWNLKAAAARRAGDMDGSLTAFERAAALDPQDSGPPANLTVTYAYLGRLAEARRWLSRAWALAPTSMYNANAELAALETEGDPEAIWQRYAELRQTPGLVPHLVDREYFQNYFVDTLRTPERMRLVAERLADPRASDEGGLNRVVGKAQLAGLLERLGQREEARALAERAKAELATLKMTSRARQDAAILAIQLDLLLGNDAAARAALAELMKAPPADFLWPIESGRGVVYAYVRAGLPEAAFDLVERAMDRFSPAQFSMVLNGVDFDGLREHPRYEALNARYQAWRVAQGLVKS
jgi:TolB-like protein/Flp pilus assembly protein TadD